MRQELTELPVELGTSTCKIQSWSIKKICVIFSLSEYLFIGGDDNDDDVTCPPVFLVLLLLVSVTA